MLLYKVCLESKHDRYCIMEKVQHNRRFHRIQFTAITMLDLNQSKATNLILSQ